MSILKVIIRQCMKTRSDCLWTSSIVYKQYLYLMCKVEFWKKVDNTPAHMTLAYRRCGYKIPKLQNSNFSGDPKTCFQMRLKTTMSA